MKHCLWCGNSLPKRRRKYCSDDCGNKYFVSYISPLWWDNARKMALERAENKCEECGNTKWLEVHHIEPLKIWEVRHNNTMNKQENLRVLCRECHEKTHHPIAYRKKIKDLSPPNQGILEL